MSFCCTSVRCPVLPDAKYINVLKPSQVSEAPGSTLKTQIPRPNVSNLMIQSLTKCFQRQTGSHDLLTFFY